MPHSVYAVEKFLGENTNQPARAHDAPQELVAQFTRTGGYVPVSPRDQITDLNWRRLAADWLGLSAWRDIALTSYELRYAQTSIAAVNAAPDITSAPVRLYAPGGGLYSLGSVLVTPAAGNQYLTTPAVPGSFFIDANGLSGIYSTPLPAAFGPTINQIGGSFAANSTIDVVFIYFERTPHGLIPIDIKYASHTLTADNRGWQITRGGFALQPGRYLYAYARIFDAGTGDVIEWTALDRSEDSAENVFNNSLGLAVTDIADWPQNARPIFYGTPIDPGSDNAGGYTFASGRAFYIREYASVWLLTVKYVPAREIVLEHLTTYEEPYTRQGVFYTDIIGNVAHLAFSDNTSGPNYLRFDDIIRAVTPSNRGIYAYSEMALWEAYGDFVNASNTRISLVPVLGGIDRGADKVAFSGDTAYFVKDSVVHSIGPAGIKQIGRAERLYERTNEVQDIGPVAAIFYDRHKRRLFALRNIQTTAGDGIRVEAYDPSVGGWYTWYDRLPNIGSLERNIVPLGSGVYRVFGYYIQETPTGAVVPLRLNWAKLDFGAPLNKKRIHRIILPYIGNYDSIDLFRLYNSDTFDVRDCTVNDRGEYFEVRCPSMVARAFDLLIQITSSDEAFALNPPLLFEYEMREASYGLQ